MSESEQEVTQFLREQMFGPRSPSEAAARQEPDPEKATPPPPGEPAPEMLPPEDAPVVVTDEPPKPPAEPFPETPVQPAVEPPPGEEEELEPELEGEDEATVWAKKKYGDDTAKWAKAARDQELYISRLANEKREAEELAGQWYEHAQQVEAQQQTLAGGMPLSASEEGWVEQSLVNPLEYARQAAFSGKTQLYNGVIQRVAEENPMLAAQIGTTVQTELAQYAAYEQQQQQVNGQPDLAQALGGSFSRLGIDLQTQGAPMAEKIAELGEYNPYVQAILHGDEGQRDLAVQAVYDLTRATSHTARRVGQNVQRENELRRDAMVVQSGGVQAPPAPPKPPAFLAGMEEEWRRRGQLAEE
jgi:hypothetical protein